MFEENKNLKIVVNINNLSKSIKKLNLYCVFFANSKKLDVKKIQKEISTIKNEIEKIESLLY